MRQTYIKSEGNRMHVFTDRLDNSNGGCRGQEAPSEGWMGSI